MRTMGDAILMHDELVRIRLAVESMAAMMEQQISKAEGKDTGKDPKGKDTGKKE